MLRVNLLPPEKRKLKKTPLYAFVPLVLGVALVMAVIAGSAFLYFETQAVEQQRAQQEAHLARLMPAVQEHDSLQRQLQDLNERIKKVLDVTQRDVEWSRTLKSILEVFGKNPKVWLEEITFLDPQRVQSQIRRVNPTARETPPFGLQLKCNVAPDMVRTAADKFEPRANPEYITKFRMDLKLHPELSEAFQDVFPPNPEWKEMKDDTALEKVFLQFEVFLFAKKKQ